MRSDAATDDSAASAPSRADARREILLRIAAAAVLAPLGLWVVYLGGIPLVAATAACAAAAAAEWTRMATAGVSAYARWILGLVTGGFAVAATIFGLEPLEAVLAICVAAMIVVGGLAALLKGPVTAMAFGAVYVSLPFGAFVWLREAFPDGRMILITLLAIVWATDIAAYFAGRGFGGPLLSPKDSPNKTWNGAIGALICAGLAAAAAARAGGAELQGWIVIGLAMSIVAQAGDLLESRCKRIFGVKDSSGIIPGHGGVLDRLDALMAASVALAILMRLFPGMAPDFPVAAGS
jgi:phosphatidate cytidylyltransferase